MAYQNVGTPMFYVNAMEWLHNTGGLTSSTNLDMIFMNPSNILTISGASWDGANDAIYFPEVITSLSGLIGANGFVAHLGHNYASCGLKVQVDQGAPDFNAATPTKNIINAEFITHALSPQYDGFSIYLADYTSQPPQLNPRLRYDYTGSVSAYNGLDVKAGSIILGTYYDMPHSPDLNLTMTREYGGIKTIETKGGASLSNAFYTSPPDWGTRKAWQLGDTDLSISGRRVWDLSFSYLSDKDVFQDNLKEIATEGESGWELDSDLTPDFTSEVIHKINGGQLPFIFQPDSSNNSPDQFAICKLDMNSFSFQQTAPGLYSVKLKIRETW